MLECYENSQNYDFDENGERAVLEALATTEINCVFDVGANIGDWTLMANRFFPKATIHSFEILEETAATLRERTAGIANVSVNECGLSDTARSVELQVFPDYPVLTNTLGLPHQFESVSKMGTVITGDSYVLQQGIRHIDFLKIDVEGTEGDVLKGLQDSLRHGRIDVIQFEYGTASIQTKFLLSDFYDLLKPLDYRIGKIYPNYIEFRDYDWRHEDFFGPNYLAVRSERSDLIQLLG
ncbi:MAG: FkbM family methyltransferase [Pseudomonadota bacterium]